MAGVLIHPQLNPVIISYCGVLRYILMRRDAV